MPPIRNKKKKKNATIKIIGKDELANILELEANDADEDKTIIIDLINGLLMFEIFDFPAWVPKTITEGYNEKGVKGLFKWQHDIVSCDNRSGNLVYSAPTSAGKSLVAELLALRVALSGKRVIFVLPYISVAREKLFFLQRLWRRIDIQVAGFIGANSAPSREWTAAICTIEKAGSLLNHAILDGVLSEYGLVVLDELHMVSDSSRGANLESIGAKLMYYNSQNSQSDIRIIAMSATISDLQKIGSWLQAKVVETEFRPVALLEQYSSDGFVHFFNSSDTVRQLDVRFRYPGDIDCTIGFSTEGFVDRQLVLVFCSSKAEVEKVAIDIARSIHFEMKSSVDIVDLIDNSALLQVKDNLERSCRELDPILLKTLPRGVAYHHAGLTSEERECIENAFRTGVVRVLVATSTLSSGVNLPANRVVIKAQTRGPAAINSISYRQMAGRAGRMGHVQAGESILVSRACDQSSVLKLVSPQESDQLKSHRDPSKIILEGVCCGMASSMEDVDKLTSFLLFPISRSHQDIIFDLMGLSLISKTNKANRELEATQLGRAALASSLPPDAAMFVFNDLQLATKALAIDTELHMLYLVTPVNTSVWQGCDWNHLHNIFTKLNTDSRRVAKMINVNERFIVSRIQGSFISAANQQLQTHLRFFSALMLYDVINEKSVAEVAVKYRVTRGSLQALQQQSATYAVMVVAFCNRLGWIYLRALLEGFASRLAFGIRSELTDLVKIQGMDGTRARVFHEHDITSLMQLAQCTVRQVQTVLSLAVPFESHNINDGLGEWLCGEPRLSLQDAADIVIKRAEESVSDNLRSLGFTLDYKELCRKPLLVKDLQSPSSNLCLENALIHNSSSHVSVCETGSSVSGKSQLTDTRDTTTRRDIGHVSYVESPGNSPVVLPESSNSKKYTRRSSRLASTPVGIRPPRPSISYSRIGDSSMDEDSLDLFTDSIHELTLDDPHVSPDDSSSNEDVINDRSIIVHENPTGEIDDLETSLMKMITIEGTSQRQREVEFDSFNESAHFTTIRNQDRFATSQLSHMNGENDKTNDSFNKTVEFVGFKESDRDKIRFYHRPSPFLEVADNNSHDHPASTSKPNNESFDSFNGTVHFSSIKSGSHAQPPSAAEVSQLRIEGNKYIPKSNEKATARFPKIERVRRSSLLLVAVSKACESNFLSPVTRSQNTDSTTSSCNVSNDLFDDSFSTSPVIATSQQKRSLKQRYTQPFSPTVSSPLSKLPRVSLSLSSHEFAIRDVCQSDAAWQNFVCESNRWSECGLSIITATSGEVTAVSFCTVDGMPSFVPMSDEYFPGSDLEEELYPSYTPCQTVSMQHRKQHISNILSSARVFCFNALQSADSLQKSGVKVSNLVCISYLAFLAHLRNGDQMLNYAQLTSKFAWPYDMHQLFRSSPRISSAASAYASIRLYDRLRSSTEKQSSAKSIEIELESLNVVNQMCANGFPFKTDLCESMLMTMREQMNLIELECHKLAGRQFNLESPPQVSDILFYRLCLPYPGGSLKSAKQRSTCKNVLEQMVTVHPIVPKIIEFRRLKHSINHCLVPLLSHVSLGVICTHMQICTATGRLLSYAPNIQNVPKNCVLGTFKVRSLFSVGKGCVLIAADYNQLELRILAHLSADVNLAEKIADASRDFFSELSIQWGFSRDCVKQMCYGIIYGMGVKSLSDATKTSIDDATALMKSFFTSFPRVQSFISDTKESASRHGYVTTLLGRRRICCMRGKQDELAKDQRQSVNYCIQGTASEIFKQAIINLNDNLKVFNARLLMTVHDEVLIECPIEQNSSSIYTVIRQSMEEVFTNFLRIPLRVTISTGPSWGELTKLTL